MPHYQPAMFPSLCGRAGKHGQLPRETQESGYQRRKHLPESRGCGHGGPAVLHGPLQLLPDAIEPRHDSTGSGVRRCLIRTVLILVPCFRTEPAHRWNLHLACRPRALIATRGNTTIREEPRDPGRERSTIRWLAPAERCWVPPLALVLGVRLPQSESLAHLRTHRPHWPGLRPDDQGSEPHSESPKGEELVRCPVADCSRALSSVWRRRDTSAHERRGPSTCGPVASSHGRDRLDKTSTDQVRVLELKVILGILALRQRAPVRKVSIVSLGLGDNVKSFAAGT